MKPPGTDNLADNMLLSSIEDEYDALNDETFGIGADDGDWEEQHNKFARANTKKKDDSLNSSFLDQSSYESEDSQNEIVSKSISQLGLELEDDLDCLDDPAIMTVGRKHSMWGTKPSPRLSPPPPAIIDTELCGSPNVHSIWSANHSSTPNKDTDIHSLLKSISNTPHQLSPLPSSPAPANVFMSPLHSKAWTVDEVEKNILMPSNSKSSESNWVPLNQKSNYSNTLIKTSDLCANSETYVNNILVNLGIKPIDNLEKNTLIKQGAHTVDEIENMQAASDLHKSSTSKNDSTILQQKQALFSPSGSVHDARASGSFSSSPVSIRSYLNENNVPSPFPVPHPLLGVPPRYLIRNRFAVPFGAPERFNNYCKGLVNPPPLYPAAVPDPQLMRLPMYSRRTIHHPLLQGGLSRNIWSQMDSNAHHGNNLDNGFINPEISDKMCMSPDENVDEYANLMTQSDKERLLRINLMLTNPENPYVEDYYYTTLMLRKCRRNALKNNKNKEGPKLLLPEKSKPENRTYVPAQFEGSLGKLQAVSVNYPRKVLDITVSRPLEDDEGRVVTNQSLTKYRRLLIDIENLYTHLLEIDDEEKRASALPDGAQKPHKIKISDLIEKIFVGLGCENVICDETYQNIMTVRKGRYLGMRAFELFSSEQKLSYLAALFRCFTTILRKDQNDHVLQRYSDILIIFIKTVNLNDLVKLGESLENLPAEDSGICVNCIVREKSNFNCAFKNKMGSSLICALLSCAEDIYASTELLDLEVQAKWAKIVLHVADILCALPDNCIASPVDANGQLLVHFQRFAIDRDKFEALKKKVKIFE